MTIKLVNKALQTLKSGRAEAYLRNETTRVSLTMIYVCSQTGSSQECHLCMCM